jgi:hypothetical protein
MPGIVKGNSPKPRDDDLCGVCESGSYTSANRHTSEFVCVKSGAVSERKKLAETAIGVCGIKEKILGAALMGARVLGVHQREYYRRDVAEIYRRSEAGRAG